MASHFSRAAFPAARGARYLLAIGLLCSLIGGRQSTATADSTGGQSTSYLAPQEAVNLFTGWQPQFLNVANQFNRVGVVTGLSVNNPTTSVQNIEFRFRRTTGETFSRIKSVPPGNSLFFSFGATAPPTPTATASPSPSLTPQPTATNFVPTSDLPTHVILQTLSPTRIPTATATAIPSATATSVVGGPAPVGTVTGTPTDQFFALPEGFVGTVTASTGTTTQDFSAAVVYGLRSGDTLVAFQALSNPSCSVSSPLFMNGADGWSSTLALYNQTGRQYSIDVQAKALTDTGGEGSLYTRSFTLPSRSTRNVSPTDLALPDGFQGSILASSCVSSQANTLATLGTLDLAALASTTGEMSGVVRHEKTGSDAMALTAASIQTSGDTFLIPLAYNDYHGWTSRIVLYNTDKLANPSQSRDISVNVTYYLSETAPGAATTASESVVLRRESPLELNLKNLPKGVLSVLLEAPTGVSPSINFNAASYHFGPSGAADAVAAPESGPGQNFDLSQNFIPLLYRAAGGDGSWNSAVRVVRAGKSDEGGAFVPRITFWDKDSGTTIGPISSGVSLRIGEAFTWNLSAMEQLQDNHIYSAILDGDVGSSSGTAQMVSTVHHINRAHNLSSMVNGYLQPLDTTQRALDLVAPIVMKNVDGLNTGIQIENLTGTDGSVTVRFRNTSGSSVGSVTVPLPHGGGWGTVYLPSVPELGDSFTGAAEIQSDVSIAAEVDTVRYR